MKSFGKAHSGFALLVVIVVLAIICVVVTEFVYSSIVNEKIAEFRRDDVVLRYGCDTGLQAVLAAFNNESDTIRAIGLSPLYAEKTKPKKIEEALDDVALLINNILNDEAQRPKGISSIYVELYDEQALYDINFLARDEKDVKSLLEKWEKQKKVVAADAKKLMPVPSPLYIEPEQFKRQVKYLSNVVLKQEEETTERIIDWIDIDSEGVYERAEDGEIKNGRLDTLSELMLISKMDSAFYRALPDVESLPVTPYITICGNGRVNVNTASKEVLAALFESEEIAEEIIKERDKRKEAGKISAFESVEDLRDISGMTDEILVSVIPQLTIESKLFRIIVTATSDNLPSSSQVAVSKTIFCIVQMTKDGAKIVFRREGNDTPR